MSVEQAYHGLGVVAMAVLVVLAILCLVRCIRGPRVSDRVLAVNMVGTLTIIMVAVLVVMLGEGYLADVALIYAMLSFLAVVVLSKIYLGVYLEKKHRGREAKKDA